MTEKEKEIIEGNGLIRVFDNPLMKIIKGWVVTKDGVKLYSVDSLKYHSSWDWLMPVVEKIEKLGYEVNIYSSSCEIGVFQTEDDYIVHKLGKVKINFVWLSIVDFIKLYNQQTNGKTNS